jgi:hypothetical protein
MVIRAILYVIDKEKLFIRLRRRPQATRLELVDKFCSWMNAKSYQFIATA